MPIIVSFFFLYCVLNLCNILVPIYFLLSTYLSIPQMFQNATGETLILY
ncbi:hypothetical protein KSS87_012701, partial [Heliosperma pusillum]